MADTTLAADRAGAGRRRFLLSCFACDPDAGSEPYVGWQWASTVYAGEDRVVLTRAHHRAALDGRAAPGLEFRYFDLPFLAGLDHRHRLMKLYYMIWQACALPYALWIVLRERITDIHHITYNAVDFPGLLWLLPGPRFFWGPVGGGQTPPPALSAYYGADWARQRRRATMKALLRVNPLVRGALRRSSLTLAANRETYDRIAPLARGPVERLLETAVATVAAAPRTPHAPLRVIWVGRFEARKAPALLVEIAAVLALSHPGRFAFTMVGGGDLLAEVRAQAAAVPGIEIRGELPFAAMRAAYAAADVLAFTSLQDTSGNVVLEALSEGMPVVALDHQGSAEILPAGGGLLVPVGPPVAVVAGFAGALLRLLDEPLYAETSRAALRNIARNHTWQGRARDWRVLSANASRVPARP